MATLRPRILLASLTSTGAWVRRQRADPYVRRAAELGYPSRAAFKLLEINSKFLVLVPGSVVVDCGAAPGGWTHVARSAVGPKGAIVSVDILPLLLPTMSSASAPVAIIKSDFTRPDTAATVRLAVEHLRPGASVSTVLSDLAPSFSGTKCADRARAAALATSALDFALLVLPRNAIATAFVCKVFQGPESDLLRKTLQEHFHQVAFTRPKSCRSESSEGYLVAKGLGSV